MTKKLKKPGKRGFAAMPKAVRTAHARKGGASVPAGKRSFAKDRDLAVRAGKVGGKKSIYDAPSPKP